MQTNFFDQNIFDDDFERVAMARQRAEVLSSVFLYDEDEEARAKVDADDYASVYSVPRMRGDESLHVLGRDLALTVDTDLADMPMDLAQRAIERVEDEGRRNGYRERLQQLGAKGGDTAQDYYRLYAQIERDGVQLNYREQKRVQKEQGEQLELLVGDMLAGRKGPLSPEEFDLLNRGGILYSDIELAGYVAGLARAGVPAEQQADILYERKASAAARQMALQQIVADALEEERKTGERGFFENMVGRFSETGEAVEELTRNLLPSERNMIHPNMMRGEDGEWLSGEEVSEKVTNRAAWLGRVREAVEQGRGMAREEIGFRVSSMPANLTSTLVHLGPWMVPLIAQGPAMGGLATDALAHGYGVQQAELEAGKDSIGDGQILGKTHAEVFAGTLPMMAASMLVRRGVGRLLPPTLMARFTSRTGGAYAANALGTTFTFGTVLPTATNVTNALYDTVAWWQDDKLDTGLQGLEAQAEQMGTLSYWGEQGLLGAVLGAPATGATRQRARRYLGDLKGALREGITRKQFESTIHLKPREQMRRLAELREQNEAEDYEGTVKRAVKESEAFVDREKAQQMRTDKAIKASMEAMGLSIENAEQEGFVDLYHGGEVLPDGTFKRGEKKVRLSRADAEVYLQAVIGYRLEGMARAMKSAAGNKRLLDAFRETLKGEVRVEWMREADNLAKFEGWATRAKERIEVRRAELEADGMEAEQARRAAEGEVHKDISDRGTLGELVSFAKNMRERYEQEVARSGKVIAPENFGSRANVTRQKLEGGGQLRRLLRIAHDARVHEVAEELGEQVMYDWRESQGMSVPEAYRYLRYFVEWAEKSENPAVAKAAGKLLSLHKTQPELAKRLMSEDFNEHDLTVDEYRAVERELTESGSTLMLSELRMAAADGNMPMWARELFDMADLGLLELGRDVNLAMALEQARQEGVLPEVAQKLFGVGREAVEAALRAEPEAPEYHRAWYEVQKRQGELDAAYGAGKLTEPSITEEFEARAREGHAAAEREREAEEVRAAEQAAERVREFEEAPENEGKSHEEAVREVAERAADAAVERLKGEPGAEADADFAGGRCLEITDEGGLVCNSGLLEVGKLKVLPNFKLGADAESGVVHPLRGDYRPDHDPIRVWRRADGELLVISGRHRLDAAKRAGATRISAYVYEESGARDLAWARRYDIESNIRDNQASVLEVALYVRGEFTEGVPLTNEQVERAGIDREGKLGSIGFRIGRRAGESVMDALRNGKIDDRVALWIADFCPGNDAVQRRGLEAALRDASKAEVLARMEAELAKQQMQEEMGLDGGMDLFGNTLDNDAFMDFVAQYVVRRRNELAQDASYLNATAKKKNAEAMAKKYGVDVKDPVALKKKLAELNALRERWKNPYSDGELMDEIRNAWRAREGADVPEGAAASVAELPSERLFREYAAREWQTERTDYSFTDDDGKLHNLSRAYATDAQGNRLGQNVYITTPNGNLDWYKFPQDEKTQKLLAAHRVKNLPIRLRVGKQESQEHRGFGFLHILNHYDDLMTIGESPLLHLYNTLSNLVKIRGGNGGRYQFKGEYEGGRDSLLIAQLLEDEGCYSMISCYPTQMNRRPQRGELVIGRVLFQFIPSSGENQIQASKTPSETTTSSVSTSGQVSAGNMPQKLATVNIYDVRIKDKDGEFFRQQYEPTVHFSAIGPNSKTWDKYPDSRKFKGRDDGKLRVEIDASGAKIKGFPNTYPVQDAMRKLIHAGVYDREEHMVYSSLSFVEDITQKERGETKLSETELKEDCDKYPDLAEEVELGLKAAGLTWESKVQEARGACFTALSKWKQTLEKELGRMNIEKPTGEAWNALVEQKPGLATVNAGKRVASSWSGKWLDDVLDFPELFEAYPVLRNIQLAESFDLGSATASYAEFAKKFDASVGKGDGEYPLGFINLNPNSSTWGNEREAKGVLLHEVQHAIQDIEGFARGGNTKSVRKVLETLLENDGYHIKWLERDLRWFSAVDIARDLLKEARMLRRYPNAWKRSGRRFEFARMSDSAEAIREKILQDVAGRYKEFRRDDTAETQLLDMPDYLLPDVHFHSVESIEAGLAALDKLQSRKLAFRGTAAKKNRRLKELQKRHDVMQKVLSEFGSEPYELYRRLAGEIEARNVQARRDWTAEERMARPFNETLEYPGEAIVTHYSICGLNAKTSHEYLEKGADYVDPADGKRKFVIPVSGARLRSDVTPGMVNVAAGGHKDVSLAALLHYPELYRAYPQLADMRVRLYRPAEATNVGGYFSPEAGTQQAAYIAVNVACRSQMLNTLLHESQHAIQHLEGFAMGAGSFDQLQALAYIGEAIRQRKAAGVKDDWSRDNLAYLELLQSQVEAGDEVAISMTYVMSHGEQEARFTGEGYGKAGANPMDDSSEERLMRGAPSSYTVAVQTQATDLGGVTFLNMGRFGYLLDSRLMPAGEFNYDRRVYQMRENVMRRMRELQSQVDGAFEADGLRLAAEGLALIDSVEALLPNTYRAALEPYKVYFNTFAKLRGSGNPGAAAATVPMRGWDMRMFGAFRGLMVSLLRGREAHGEFWEHAFREIPDAEAGLESMREYWAEAHEEVQAEYAERLADAPNAKARAKLQAQVEAETYNRVELQFGEELNKMYQAMGRMRADKLMAKFLERVALQLDAFRKDTTLGRIRRVVDRLRPLPGKDGKPVKGRMAADAYNKVMDMMRLLELTKGEKLAFERTRYTGEEGCPDGKLVWSELEPDAQVTVHTYDAEGERVTISCTKQEYETYACFDGMTAAQAESAGKALGEFITTGRQAWENMEELRKQRIAKMCSPLMEKHAETLNDERRRLHSERRGRLPHEKGWLTREGFARRIHSLFGNWMNDAQFFDAMTGVPEVEGFARDFTVRMAKAKVYIEAKEKERRAMMMEAVFEASGAKTANEAREFIDHINKTEQTGIVLRAQEPDFLEQETGTLRMQFLGLLRRKTHKKNFSPNTFAAMMKYLSKQGADVVPAHIIQEAMAKYGEIGDAEKSRLHGLEAMTSVLTTREFERFRNLTAAAKARAQKAREKWLEEKAEKGAAERPVAEEGLELTRSEAAYRVLLCEQADYEETLRRQGYTQEVVNQLREFAGERMMRLAYRLRAELGARTPQIKEMYERVYGMPFPEVENYFRAYFNVGYEVHSESIMGGAGEGRAAGKGTAKILYTRHHHNAKIDPTMNVLTAFECAMKEQDVMLGYGDLPTDISSVLNFRDGDMRMSEALAKVFSSHTVAEMKTIAENMTRAVPASEEVGRWLTRCLSAMSSSSATAILNYRVGTLFKQGTALFNTLAGSDRVSMWEWYKAAGRVHAGLGMISLKELAARPELDGRFKGWAAGVEAEAMLGDADVISAKGATNAAARAGMSLMEWIDMRANVRSCATLYDAVYRKMQKEHPELSHEALDAEAMLEVRRALAFKSQPLDWRSRSLQATKRSLFTIGNLFLGGESINTMGNVVRLLSRGKKGDKRKAVAVWLQHGMALQVLTALYNWMTDDEEQWERRSWRQYVAGSVLGPLAGLPLVSAVVGMGTGVVNAFLPKEWRVWMPTQSLLPMADMERVASDLRKVFWGKKPSSWQDKTIAVENFVRTVATFGILASRNPTTVGGAKMKAVTYGVAAVTNILDFLLRTERALEERALD